MVTALQSAQTAWTKGILQPAQEFGPCLLEVLSGAIPATLRGSLYRNGPALLARGDRSVGHWFDGDGGILAVQFANQNASGLYRYVQTKGFQQEERAGHYTTAGYGMIPPGAYWTRFFRDLKNAANTSVLALPNKLLALWEGGLPHALDLETLETRGLDDLDGLNGRSFSAHPKRDPQTGDIYNFGVSMGANSTLNLYRLDAAGKVQQTSQVALSGLPLIHDCAIAGRYLVFCVPPVRVNSLPLLARLQSFSDAMEWKPELGTEIIMIDRNTLQVVSRTTTDPWYQWHFGNGCELLDGTIAIDIIRYDDFQTNVRLKEVVSGQIHTRAEGTLWQLRLDPQSGQVLEMVQILDRSCEFPITPQPEVGQPSRYTYLSLHRRSTNTQTEVFDAIGRFDTQIGTLTEANLGVGCYPNEPIYAPDVENPDDGWVLTVLYNGTLDRSELWIFAADRLDDQPVCRLALPQIVPIGFHGTWRNQ